MAGKYYYTVVLIDADRERANELREILGRIIRRAGKARLTSIVKRVLAGEQVPIYQTNDARDAEDKAHLVGIGGAAVKIIGL
ncbi:MAG: hypothetical protein JW797_18355 [Bradymonadales bacterium]|nr:hypothetical protein [Bradymonadales bacterium]